jgi:signal transduction histidine kinase
VDAVAITVKEITELKQKEADLIREKKRVEEANQAKSRFLAHMSHELRTPMGCIIGMCNFLLETELSRDQQEYAAAIQQNATSLLQILNDISTLECADR